MPYPLAARSLLTSAQPVLLEAARTVPDNDYDVSNITYDANGNILTLKRNKSTPPSGEPEGASMDDLAYTYKNGTNQLSHVDDAASL